MSRRTERLSAEIHDEIARILPTLKDPRVQWVSVTRASVTNDLSYAKIGVGVLGDEKARQNALKGLQSAAGYIRRELAQRLRLRKMPELHFEYDKGLDATERVARLLFDVKTEQQKIDEARAAETGTETDDHDHDGE